MIIKITVTVVAQNRFLVCLFEETAIFFVSNFVKYERKVKSKAYVNRELYKEGTHCATTCQHKRRIKKMFERKTLFSLLIKHLGNQNK